MRLRSLAALVVAGVAVPAGGPVHPLQAQALPFHTATGITAGFQENAGRALVSFLGRSGLIRDGEAIGDPLDREIDALAVVAGAIPFSFTPFLSTRIVVPWARRSMEFTGPGGLRRRFDASGLDRVTVDAKWVFLRGFGEGSTTRLGLQAGAEIPLGRTDETLPSGEVAPPELQVGSDHPAFPVTAIFTATRRRWGFHANTGWTFETGDRTFTAGDVFRYDAAVGFRFVPWVYEGLTDPSVVAYLELNGRVRQGDEVNGVRDADSGGHLLFFSPDLQWIPTPWLLFEGSVQIPVVQALDGTQLEHEPRFQLGTRIRFSVIR